MKQRLYFAAGILVICFLSFSSPSLANFNLELKVLNYNSFDEEAKGFLISADNAIRLGKFDLALGDLRKATRLEKDVTLRQDIQIREAKVNLYKGRVGYARFLLNKLCRVRFYSPAFVAAAQSYLYFEPYDRNEAKKRLGRVLKTDPKNVDALIEMGYVHLFLLNRIEASKKFKKARKLNKNAMRAFYGLADVLVKQGKHMDGVRILEKALRIQPENGLTMLKIGDIYLASKGVRRTYSAISWYEMALEYANDRPIFYSRIIMGFFAGRKAVNAKPFLAKLREIAPNNSYALWADGVFAELKGKLTTAKSKYFEAMTADSQNWLAHFCYANICAGRGTEEFVLWAKTMKYKYDVHKNLPKGIEAYKRILNNALSFPFYKTADIWYQKLIETPTVNFWTDPANKEKLKQLQRYGKALKLGMW